MLKIRLQRTGRRKRPFYKIVVAEHSAPIQGRYVAAVGSYDPIVDKHGLNYDQDAIMEWIGKGAKPTNTVARLLKGAGVSGMDGFVVKMQDRKVKNPKEKPEAPAADEKPAEEKAEEPVVEEVKAEEEPASNQVKEAAKPEKGEAPAADEAKEDVKLEEPAAVDKKETSEDQA